jgi:hypothetical protein
VCGIQEQRVVENRDGLLGRLALLGALQRGAHFSLALAGLRLFDGSVAPLFGVAFLASHGVDRGLNLVS